jgi:hypothetical protein
MSKELGIEPDLPLIDSISKRERFNKAWRDVLVIHLKRGGEK